MNTAMRKLLTIAFFFLSSYFAKAQFGVSIHQSNLPFVGFNYELKERILPEFRLGVDNLAELLSVELTVSYIFKKDEWVNAYAGLGGRVNNFNALVIPVGLNIYPFERKNFGFQMEAASLLGNAALIRGSWGIRYRFKEK
jgi:hypothetical protein